MVDGFSRDNLWSLCHDCGSDSIVAAGVGRAAGQFSELFSTRENVWVLEKVHFDRSFFFKPDAGNYSNPYTDQLRALST